jgi:hypothetical protein
MIYLPEEPTDPLQQLSFHHHFVACRKLLFPNKKKEDVRYDNRVRAEDRSVVRVKWRR